MQSGFRILFLVYFITHIPITLLIDLQALLGDHYPPVLQNIYLWYTTSYNDVLMTEKPIWLRSFITAELLFQLPFFFIAVYGFWMKKIWIRTPSIIYGAHTTTTVIPILSEIIFSTKNTLQEKYILFGFYFPYFFVPFLLMVIMSLEQNPFETKKKKS